MKVLVDTTIWSLALRRRERKPSEQRLVGALAELIQNYAALLIGPIRQEVLSGVANPKQFRVIQEYLRAFEDEPILTSDYEAAANMYNACRAKGVQGSHVDFLICAVSVRCSVPIFTTDKDFKRYARHVGIKLYEPIRG